MAKVDLTILIHFIFMKEVIQGVLSSKEYRTEESLAALVAKTQTAGSPWLGAE